MDKSLGDNGAYLKGGLAMATDVILMKLLATGSTYGNEDVTVI